MATRTETVLATLTTEVALLRLRLDAQQRELDLLRDVTNQIATLRTQVETMKPLQELPERVRALEVSTSELIKRRELWGQRGWAVVAIGLSALVSISIALLTFFLNAKK